MKIGSDVIQTLVTFLVGGGLATLITQTVRAATTVRSGARASTRAVVRDLADARNEAEQRLDIVQKDLFYWRGLAGNYAYQLRAHNVEPQPAEPLPPSEARRRAERRRKLIEDSGDITR